MERKISRALGRGDVTDASRLEINASRPEKTGKPRYTLDHVIRERYPTFNDAIRDLDDCLSMLFLFANLPSTDAVPAKMIARCERLCLEFQHYLIVSGSLRKSFLSIKGIYYQANIQGEDVLWVVPYKFNQRVVGDVDFRIMGTFVEFYMTMLGFINFRLYTSVGLKYPPKFDKTKDEGGAELGAFRLEGTHAAAINDAPAQPAITNGEAEKGPDPKTQAKVDKLIRNMREDESSNGEPMQENTDQKALDDDPATHAMDKYEPQGPDGDKVVQPELFEGGSLGLFANCTVYLSRETPRQALEFILRSFGCKRIGWDAVLGEGAFTTDESDPTITHQIVDRPVTQPVVETDDEQAEDNQMAQKLASNRRMPGRTYIQPQWVWDSVNDGELKRPDLYAPGAELPPHLSPFVQQRAGDYDPSLPLAAQEPADEALEYSDEDEEATAEGMDVAGSDEDEEGEKSDGSFGGFSGDEEDEEEDAELQHQKELEAEISGKRITRSATKPQDKAKAEARKKLAKQARDEAEEVERAKGMLSKKKRRLYDMMEYTNNKKSDQDKALRAKRRKLEKEKAEKAKAKAGK